MGIPKVRSACVVRDTSAFLYGWMTGPGSWRSEDDIDRVCREMWDSAQQEIREYRALRRAVQQLAQPGR